MSDSAVPATTRAAPATESPESFLPRVTDYVFDAVSFPMLVLDSSFVVCSANSAFYEMFATTASDTEGIGLFSLSGGTWDLPSFRSLVEGLLQGGPSFEDFAFEHDFPGVGHRVMLLNGRILHGRHVLLAMEEVTERRRSPQHLLEQIESYAQDVVDTVREPLLILDSSLRVHSANRAFYQTFHVSAEETENRLIYELGNGQWDIPDLRTLLEDIVPMSSVFNDFELEHDFPVIGRRVMLLNARKLRQGSHAELLVLAMEDVTERRRAEAEVAKAKEAAETANRTKSLFVANMSHELRTPLNAILGFSEMLQEEAVDRELTEFSADLQKISTAGKHLLGLINDILDLSKIEAGKMELHLEVFDIPSLIAEVASTIEMQVASNGNSLEVVCPVDIGVMRADSSKVRQGLFNLVSNAAKFTHGGQIRVEAERQTMDGLDWIIFRVSDTGIGLSADQIVRLFQSFTQADASTTRRFGGTGLGLALTRRFCQMMGGDVTVHSVSGEGSTFTIKLPATIIESIGEVVLPSGDVASEVAEADSGEEDEQPPPVRTCVLVIDDDPLQRDLMRRYLRKEGYAVRTASSGAQGLRMARQLLPAAITLDVMMPEMDGWSVLTALKGDLTLRDIPVIMLTMIDDPERGFTLGASEYATKPVNRRRLSQILRKYTCLHPPCPVLVVDDDAAFCSMMRTMLEREGWAVTEAANGEDALQAMERERPSLIFTDLLMPEMDGFTFAAEVRRHPEWRSIPIVVVTSQDLSNEDRRRLNGHVDTVIRKDGSTRDALLEQVRGLLAENHTPRISRDSAEVLPA
jgi:signal transduction histidine kinase/CheY-like chemotaxis protein